MSDHLLPDMEVQPNRPDTVEGTWRDLCFPFHIFASGAG